MIVVQYHVKGSWADLEQASGVERLRGLIYAWFSPIGRTRVSQPPLAFA